MTPLVASITRYTVRRAPGVLTMSPEKYFRFVREYANYLLARHIPEYITPDGFPRVHGWIIRPL